MKCLANWPLKSLNGDDSAFPSYHGFEMDVFSVVKDYFLGLRVPLVTYELYDIFVSAYIKVENMFHQFRLYSKCSKTGIIPNPDTQ